MSWSIKLFNVRGIDVNIHLTFVLVLIWVAYVWGAGAGAGIAGALFGVVATILLFGCVTLHELAHSLVAMSYGIRVRGILLLPIGGVSQIEDMPDKPAQELRIALAGPLTSLAIAVVLFVVLAIVGQLGSATLDLSVPLSSAGWVGMLAYLAAANLLLGLFNLLPAFPMDGGRVLRALLAMRLDYAQATRIAAGVGQALAIGLALIGFLIGNFFLVFIAIFIWLGAGQEGGEVQSRGVLRDLTVRQAMTRTPLSLAPSDPLSRAVDLILSSEQGDFPVQDSFDDRPVGLLTREDVLRGLRSHDPTAPVTVAMRTTYLTATPDESLYALKRRMLGEGGAPVVVVDAAGKLLGLLTVLDLNEALLFLGARSA